MGSPAGKIPGAHVWKQGARNTWSSPGPPWSGPGTQAHCPQDQAPEAWGAPAWAAREHGEPGAAQKSHCKQTDVLLDKTTQTLIRNHPTNIFGHLGHSKGQELLFPQVLCHHNIFFILQHG